MMFNKMTVVRTFLLTVLLLLEVGCCQKCAKTGIAGAGNEKIFNGDDFFVPRSSACAPKDPLHVAAHLGRIDQVAALIRKKGVDLDKLDSASWQTPLMHAVASRHGEVVELLISNGAFVSNGLFFPNHTLLHEAALQGGYEVSKLLLSHGGKAAAIEPVHKMTPLHYAAALGRQKLVRLLLKHGAKVNAKSRGMKTPLHLAVWGGHLATAAVLIDKGADLEVETLPHGIRHGGGRALHYAVSRDHVEIAVLLVAKGANIDAVDTSYSQCPLIWALQEKRKKIAKFLIASGANVNTPDLQGDTPLVFAAGQGQTELVSLLVSRGAKINARSNDGSSALNVAMFPPHDDTARLLLKLGAEHDIFSASAMGLMDKVKSIIRADKNAVNKSTVGGYTALHWAVGQDKLEMVKLLVNSGADVNALPHGYPFSPLFIARQKKFKAVDDWLVSKGATMEGDRDAWPERTPEEFATQPTTRPAE